MRLSLQALSLVLLGVFSAANVFAAPPACWSNKDQTNLPVMNEKVLEWKSRKNFRDRALVTGQLARVVRMRKTHAHFEVQLAREPSAKIEIVYNREFGELPELRSGMQVDVCGDYITTTNSSTGAIIHWVHFNPGDRDGGVHEHGYVVIDGVVYGNKDPGPNR